MKKALQQLIFDLQRFTVTLPTNPDTSAATVGKDYLLYIGLDSATSPAWTLIGAQRGATLNRSSDSIDLSHKTSGGWGAKKQGIRSWSIDLDALMLLTDAGITALDQAYMTGVDVYLKFEYPDGTYQTGWGSVTDFSLDTPHDGEAAISGTIDGNGALSSRLPSISPLAATMSLAAAADKTFTITPTTTTISSITNDSTTLTVSTHYTYSSGTLTIKSTYLSTLSAGTYSLIVKTGESAELTITITITA